MARGQAARVLIASECGDQLEAWRSAFKLHESIEVAGAAAGRSRLLARLAATPIEILVLAAGLGTLEVLEEVHAQSPETKILIVGDSQDEAYIFRALQLGVRGFLSGCDPADHAKAIGVVAAGDLWVARRTLVRLLKGIPQGLPASHAPRPSEPLTTREREIAAWIGCGMTNKEIGKALGVSDRTIKVHLGHIFKKLHIHRRIQLLLDRASPNLLVAAPSLPRQDPSQDRQRSPGGSQAIQKAA